MKKYVIIVLGVALLLASMFAFLYWEYSPNCKNDVISEVVKIGYQAMLTGTVTFSGLFFTILSQEQQSKKKQRIELCPCIVVTECNVTASDHKVESISATGNVRVCCSDKSVKLAEVTIANCKDNYGINLSLLGNECTYPLGNLAEKEVALKIALSPISNKLVFLFEDVYGLKYRQEIHYQYDGQGRISFTAQQPTRRKKS